MGVESAVISTMIERIVLPVSGLEKIPESYRFPTIIPNPPDGGSQWSVQGEPVVHQPIGSVALFVLAPLPA